MGRGAGPKLCLLARGRDVSRGRSSSRAVREATGAEQGWPGAALSCRKRSPWATAAVAVFAPCQPVGLMLSPCRSPPAPLAPWEGPGPGQCPTTAHDNKGLPSTLTPSLSCVGSCRLGTWRLAGLVPLLAVLAHSSGAMARLTTASWGL